MPLENEPFKLGDTILDTKYNKVFTFGPEHFRNAGLYDNKRYGSARFVLFTGSLSQIKNIAVNDVVNRTKKEKVSQQDRIDNIIKSADELKKVPATKVCEDAEKAEGEGKVEKVDTVDLATAKDKETIDNVTTGKGSGELSKK